MIKRGKFRCNRPRNSQFRIPNSEFMGHETFPKYWPSCKKYIASDIGLFSCDLVFWNNAHFLLPRMKCISFHAV